MAASRTFEGGTIGGEHPLIDAVTGMAASTLDLDHRRASPPPLPPLQDTIRSKDVQLCAIIRRRFRSLNGAVMG